MARPLRIEYPGAWYHVMNRGAAKQTIFHNSTQFHLFLSLLEEVYKRYGVEVHAYCLMNNHYHLLLRTPDANLGKVMHYISSNFTLQNNRLIGRDGPLFRGRYKAILVEADSYLLQLSRYIHLNPVSAKIEQKPEKYYWSSYRYFILNEKKPIWLFCDETLSRFSGEYKSQKYKNFISDGIDKGILLSLERKKIPSIIGSESFIHETQKKYVLNRD